MFWNKKDLTALDVIERELQRLHEELASITWVEAPETVDPSYALIMSQIDKLNQQLVEIAKGTR